MIDIEREKLIPVRDVPKRLPRRPNGKKLHVSAVYRWIQKGVRGVRLESTKIGRTSYTSTEALQRFAERLNNDGASHAEPSRHHRAQHARHPGEDIQRILYPERRDQEKSTRNEVDHGRNRGQA